MHTFNKKYPTITIITPTYNRCHTLQRLFDSLERQRHQIHQWIVVDDGSSDSTRRLMQSRSGSRQNIKDIVYVEQMNQGKHVAINNGLNYATGDYIAIVDSDDFLTDGCIEMLLELVNKHCLTECVDIVAVSGSKIDSKGQRISFRTENEVEVMTHHEWFYILNRFGDRLDFYKREAVCNRRFNVFPGEKFLTEDAYWLTIPGNKLFTNFEMLQGDYLTDGLTAKYSSLLSKNPFGMVFYYYVLVGLYGVQQSRAPAKIWALLFYYFVLAVGKMSRLGAVLGLFSLPLTFMIKKLKK